MTEKKTRRNFLITSVAVAGGIAGSATLQQDLTNSAKPPAKMPERLLGRTGVKVPIFGLGEAGQTPLSQEGAEKESAAIIERALALGIRYFDTAALCGCG